MPKLKGSEPSFVTKNVGHAKRWTKEQQKLIDASLPAWYEFSFVKHKDLDGRDSRLTLWKKNEADRLLMMDEFKPLPGDVSLLNTLCTGIKLILDKDDYTRGTIYTC